MQELYNDANDLEYNAKQQLDAKVASGAMSQENLDKITSGDTSSMLFLDPETAQWAKTWQDARKQRVQYAKDVKDINYDIATEEKSLQESINKIREDSYSTWLKTVTDIADQVVEAYRNMYRQELDIEEQRHKDVMDNLDDELTKYEEAVNAKLKLLDRQDDAESYDKQLTKAQAERNATDAQITTLSRDTSMETQAKVAELKKKLAEQDENIEEMKAKRSKDLQKQSLQDNLDNFKKETEANKTKENTLYNDNKNRINAEINDEKHWSEVRQAILSGDQAKIKSVMTDLNNGIAKYTGLMGQSIDQLVNVNLQNLITKIEATYKALENRPNITPPAPVQSLRQYVGTRNTVDYDATSDSVKVGNKTYTASQLQSAGLFMQNDTWKGTVDILKKLLGFDTGGYTGSFDGGKLGILHQKELILNRADTGNILAAVNMVRQIMPTLKQPAMAGVGPVPVNVNLNIAKVEGSERGGKTLVNTFVGELEKMGVSFTRK
jgi:hypothetical protein